MEKNRPAARVAFLGILFALALALSLIEGIVPLPVPIPGVRLGLSNIVVMYCLVGQGAGYALTLSVLKSLFALMTRGVTGALLSLAGGVLSVGVMAIIMRLKRGGYSVPSVLGAVSHNVGQLTAAALFLREGAILWYYLPVLSAVGVLVGILTSVLLRAVLPELEKVRW